MPRPLRRAAAIGLALAVCVAPATGAPRKKPAAAPPATLSPASFKVERYTLKNGLTLLTHEDHSVPTVTLWQWFKVGSRNERPGITGISHFFEHMMFNGAAKYGPKLYDRTLESSGGLSNAFTDRDVTAYYEDIASDRYEVLLDLDSDRMASLALVPDLIKSEREVVKEERRFRTDNFVPGMLDEALYAAAFTASPYHWPVVGWMGDLDAITREQMVDYFRTYYAPNNCVLIMTGDFNTAQARQLVERYFGPIAAQTPPPRPVNAEAEQRGERRVFVHYPAENVHFQVGFKAAPADSPQIYALGVLEKILAEGESSRLHQALVYEQQLALSTSTSFYPRLEPALFELYVELRPGKSAAEGEKALDEVLRQVAEKGVTGNELAKAKNQIEADFVRSLTTNNGVGEQIGFYETIFGDWRHMFTALDRYRAVTAAEVQAAARQTFDARQRTAAVLVPETGEGE
jgi:predicted Zn-dependent peptidase